MKREIHLHLFSPFFAKKIPQLCPSCLQVINLVKIEKVLRQSLVSASFQVIDIFLNFGLVW